MYHNQKRRIRMRIRKAMKYNSHLWQAILIALVTVVIGNVTALAEIKKPNILIIWGDDIGEFNISAYNLGQMGYRTPNIDSLADQGALFTDWYGQQSCTTAAPHYHRTVAHSDRPNQGRSARHTVQVKRAIGFQPIPSGAFSCSDVSTAPRRKS